MTDPDLYQQRSTLAYYWYHGTVPGLGLHVISMKNGEKAFIVGDEGFKNWYTKVPNFFKEGKTYTRIRSGAEMFVEKVFKNPSTGELVAFVWFQNAISSYKYAVLLYPETYTQFTEKV